jgi:hypothetical protein
MTEDEVRDRLKRACDEAGSKTAWATKNGISLGYVSDVLQNRRGPGDAILQALGLEREVIYRPKETA